MTGLSEKDSVDKESCSEPCELHHPLIYRAFEDWLKVVVPRLVLADYVGVMKVSLSFGHTVVALAYNRCNRQYKELGEYAIQRHAIHFCAGCGTKGMCHHKSKLTL